MTERSLSLDEALSNIGKGWHPLVKCFYTCAGQTVVVDQVKEKFGGLRIYCRNNTAATKAYLEAIETLSFSICEHCGAPGTARSIIGRRYTLCGRCFAKSHKRAKQEFRRAVWRAKFQKLWNRMIKFVEDITHF